MDQQRRQHQPLLLEQSLGGAMNPSTLGHPRLNALGDTPMELEHVRLGSLVKDISTIRHHQHAISADLQHLHNDNEILWRETLVAREKHQRHQQVIERILLFLTSVFSTDGFSATTPKGMPFPLGKQNDYLRSPSR
jgi:heat shock transcription factor